MNEMTFDSPPTGPTLVEYAAIENAVMETARGRWFLLEYARRQRAVETQRLADAVDRLEAMIAGVAPAATIAPEAAREDAPVDATAAAVAERLSDMVWTMRERGIGDQFCAELEKQIRIIRTLGDRIAREAAERPQITAPPLQITHEATPLASSPEDQRTAGAPEPVEDAPVAFPQGDNLAGEPVREQTHDNASACAAVAAIADAPVADFRTVREKRIAALSRLDALPISEKIALFC